MTVLTLRGESYYSTLTIEVPIPLRRRIEARLRRCPIPENEFLVAALEAGLDHVPEMSVLGNAS
jgi:hypothetical protein